MKRAQNAVSVRVTVDHISVNAQDVPLASLVTDQGDELTLPAALLPTGTVVGEVLLLRLARDPSETAARAALVADLQRKLFG